MPLSRQFDRSLKPAGEKQLIPNIMQNIKTKKIFMTKRESEFMGLKYYLGHTAYVQ